MRRSAVLLVTAACLAGCSDEGSGAGAGEGGNGTAGPHGAHAAATHILAPAWELGQWWTWTSEQASGPFTYVVSAEAGQDWIVDTDSPEIAFFDARSDISLLGPVRKSDLAGSQGAQRVEFFQFPLTAHKNWTTTWDGLPMSVHVLSIEGGKAQLEARHENGTRYAGYSYDARLGYLRETTFYAPDGTTVGFAAKVTSSGKAFGGDLVRWTLETKYETHGPFPGPTAQGFGLDPGVTDVWTDLHLACTQGAFSITFGPTTGAPQQRGFTASGPCPAQLDETATISPPQDPNEPWGVVLSGVPQAMQATLDLTLIARTQASFKVGQAP